MSNEPERNAPDPALNFQGEMYAQKQYEFTPAENEMISGLASKMRVVGLFNVILGVVLVAMPFVLHYAFGYPQLRVTPMMAGLLFLLTGMWTRGASVSFDKITASKERDITNLMKAVDDLDGVYGLQYGLILMGLLVMGSLAIYFIAVDATGAGNVFSY